MTAPDLTVPAALEPLVALLVGCPETPTLWRGGNRVTRVVVEQGRDNLTLTLLNRSGRPYLRLDAQVGGHEWWGDTDEISARGTVELLQLLGDELDQTA